MPKIFISYRRSDSDYVTAAIASKLKARFGNRSVFMDVDTIPIGHDFRDSIRLSLEGCDVAIIVIGKQWLDAFGVLKTRRIDEPTDFVRIEVESVLNRGIPVVPLLVGGAVMPQPSDLPISIKELAYRQAVEVRPGRDFEHDIQRLIKSLSQERKSKSRKHISLGLAIVNVTRVVRTGILKVASGCLSSLSSSQDLGGAGGGSRRLGNLKLFVLAYFAICSLVICLGYFVFATAFLVLKQGYW